MKYFWECWVISSFPYSLFFSIFFFIIIFVLYICLFVWSLVLCVCISGGWGGCRVLLLLYVMMQSMVLSSMNCSSIAIIQTIWNPTHCTNCIQYPVYLVLFVLLISLVFCVFRLSSCCVLCVQCCQCLWVVH